MPEGTHGHGHDGGNSNDDVDRTSDQRTMDMPVALVVEDVFLISGLGLLLTPVLRVSMTAKSGAFRPFGEDVMIRRPDNTSASFRASFVMSQSALVGGGCRWDIVVTLPDATKADVPIGSEVHVSDTAMAAVRRGQGEL